LKRGAESERRPLLQAFHGRDYGWFGSARFEATVENAASLTFVLTALSAILSRLALFGILKQRLPRVSFFLSTTFLYVEIVDLRNRRALGSRKLDWLALSVFLSLPIAIAAWIWPERCREVLQRGAAERCHPLGEVATRGTRSIARATGASTRSTPRPGR
jgi:hypothetical protein